MGFGDKGAKDKNREKEALKKANEEEANEDAKWNDSHKGNKAKDQRAADKAASAEEKERRKQELKELEAAEEAENAKLKGANKKAPTKATRAEIQRNAALMNALAASKAPTKTKKTTTVAQPKLEPNRNFETDVVEASGIDAALAALELDGAKPAGKMTYKQFESENTENIKRENPGLKHSQLKELVWKQWERSPDNPKNQTA